MSKRAALLLAFLAICLVGSVTYYFHLFEARSSGSLFITTYDPIRDILITRSKVDGRLCDVGYDRNQDLQDDSAVVYDLQERPSTIWVDEDYNGVLEVQYLYDRKGRMIARYEDIGQDGHVEEYIRHTADSAFIYRDRNEDGWFEERELERSEAHEPVTAH
jgi:uncharacterized protein (UPF0333 family)